jgi:hypothetical protein
MFTGLLRHAARRPVDAPSSLCAVAAFGLAVAIRIPSIRIPSIRIRIPSVRIPSICIPSICIPSICIPSICIPSVRITFRGAVVRGLWGRICRRSGRAAGCATNDERAQGHKHE